MSWGDAIDGVTGLFGANQAGNAAEAQERAAQRGLDWTKQVYGDAQQNFGGYLNAGQQGLGGLSALAGGDYSGFMNSPDFKARVGFANDQFNNGAAAKYRLFSGGAQNDRDTLNQNLAAQGLGDYRNSLFGMAQMGQNAAGTLGGIGTQTAQQVNSAYNNIGQAQANGYGASAGGISGLGGLLGNQSWASRPIFGGTTSSYGGGGSLGNWGDY